MISISFFEVSCQSYVSLSCYAGCDSRLIYNVVCEALSFEGALVFLSAVAFFHKFCDRVDGFRFCHQRIRRRASIG